MRKILFLCLFMLIFYPVFSQNIVGLWLVEYVKIGEESMTPQARWMRFNEDGSQQSGNGWTQHSIGTYIWNGNSLTIDNENGLKDPFEAFEVLFEEEKMIWKRQEEGQEVQVVLSKTNGLPAFGRDKILGAWEVSTLEGEKLMFRWDQVFVKMDVSGNKEYGVYKVHGHKPEVELIYYKDECKREYLNYSIIGDSLTFSDVKNAETNPVTYLRTNQF